MKKIFFLFLLFSSEIFAQGNLKIANLGNLKTTSGKIIKNCKLGYRTFGKQNADNSNAILFPTWFGGKSQDLKAQAGSTIDTTKYFLVLVDALGNGVSSSPSNSLNFPDISIRDMVNAEYELLVNHLNIKHLMAIMGVSMGGMQTFEWLVAYPDFMEKAIPIVGTPKQSFNDVVLWKTEWDIIEAAGKSPQARKNAMKLVADIHNLNLFSPDYYSHSKKAEETPKAMKDWSEEYTKGNNPENWICQIKAMLGQDIYKSSGKSLTEMPSFLKAKILVISAIQDHMVNPTSAIEFAKFLNTNYLELSGNCGHLSTWCEGDKMTAGIKDFLK